MTLTGERCQIDDVSGVLTDVPQRIAVVAGFDAVHQGGEERPVRPRDGG
ncbi:hypothetical protein ACH4ND_06595 [Streptomyces sp. NPDC017179]